MAPTSRLSSPSRPEAAADHCPVHLTRTVPGRGRSGLSASAYGVLARRLWSQPVALGTGCPLRSTHRGARVPRRAPSPQAGSPSVGSRADAIASSNACARGPGTQRTHPGPQRRVGGVGQAPSPIRQRPLLENPNRRVRSMRARASDIGLRASGTRIRLWGDPRVARPVLVAVAHASRCMAWSRYDVRGRTWSSRLATVHREDGAGGRARGARRLRAPGTAHRGGGAPPALMNPYRAMP